MRLGSGRGSTGALQLLARLGCIMDGDHSVAKPCGIGSAAVAPLEIVEQNPALVLLGDLGKPVVVDLFIVDLEVPSGSGDSGGPVLP